MSSSIYEYKLYNMFIIYYIDITNEQTNGCFNDKHHFNWCSNMMYQHHRVYSSFSLPPSLSAFLGRITIVTSCEGRSFLLGAIPNNTLKPKSSLEGKSKIRWMPRICRASFAVSVVIPHPNRKRCPSATQHG